ncbi:transcriptional regulator, ArgR family [Pilibacter termitis]|uniref:Arginine repressor n=1 Tax=Pilibacter termitis TaxID=263852 RepID=A0A1T4LAI6_9ENTE|nr:arginine repressor [Pilibacter termitis]SJZ51601.1 transcriptional regulator, ArgR family [Pilibacter termitis]
MKRKQERQEKILSLIQEMTISTQEELLKQLSKNNFQTTQATLSRDIQELNLNKIRTSPGKFAYVPPRDTHEILAEEEIRRSASKIDRVDFLLVIHTTLGKADILANIFDEAKNEEIVGTIAGADTLFIAFRDKQIAKKYEEKFKGYL